MRYTATFLILALIAVGCEDDEEYPEFEVLSVAFGAGETIPIRHTCDGANISPPLSFIDAPEETRGFAIIMEDPDAPLTSFVHWVIWGIPSSVGILNEDQNLNATGTVAQGTNSNDENGYTGPCPPEGERHRYFFSVYALDENITDMRPDARKEDLLKRMKKHIVGKGELLGIYSR